MSAGYSGTPLAKKLGIKPGIRVVALGAPPDYAELLAPIPDGASLVDTLSKSAAFVHFFTTERATLETELPQLKAALAADGILWISWPKKAAKVKTDLDGNVVRQLGLAIGLVDVKVCAVDATWSGLKFVYRLKDR
ncbi:MAG: DUF3052 domain-containing protein [Acidobacteriota bacterium]